MNEGYCPFCDNLIQVQDGKLVKHKPCSGRVFDCPGTGREPNKESSFKKWLEKQKQL